MDVFFRQYVGIIITALVVFFGWLMGRMVERNHFRSLEAREAAVKHIIETNLRTPPDDWIAEDAMLVHGQAVIGSDAFKTFASKLRGFFGGELRAFETLMDRSRREARLRLFENASQIQANVIWNIRFETSNIGRSQGKKGLPMAEVHAFATAMRIQNL